jgi:hypothetical protein
MAPWLKDSKFSLGFEVTIEDFRPNDEAVEISLLALSSPLGLPRAIILAPSSID